MLFNLVCINSSCKTCSPLPDVAEKKSQFRILASRMTSDIKASQVIPSFLLNDWHYVFLNYGLLRDTTLQIRPYEIKIDSDLLYSTPLVTFNL